MNYRNAQVLNFESVKQLVMNMDDHESLPVHNPQKITRDAKRLKVLNKEETKVYRTVYEKRVIQDDYTTLPYGY